MYVAVAALVRSELTFLDDSSGQICPPNTTVRVTATLWEAEATLVFHVDVQPEGIRVSRREDTDMILASPLMVLGGMLQKEIDHAAEIEVEKHVVRDGPVEFNGLW